MKYSFIIVLFFVSNLTFAQQSNFLPKGLGFEIGLGYNQLSRHILKHNGPFPLGSNGVKDNLYFESLKLTPSIRLSYKISIFDFIALTPMIEYSILGGKAENEPNGLEYEFVFKTLNLGLIASYTYENIILGGGL